MKTIDEIIISLQNAKINISKNQDSVEILKYELKRDVKTAVEDAWENDDGISDDLAIDLELSIDRGLENLNTIQAENKETLELLDKVYYLLLETKGEK